MWVPDAACVTAENDAFVWESHRNMLQMPNDAVVPPGGASEARGTMNGWRMVKLATKHALTMLGAHSPTRLLVAGEASLRYMSIGRWMADHGYRVPRRVRNREQVWDVGLGEVRDRRVLYLEFGVWKGAALRYWSSHLRNPVAALHGFDSFEGLPETFTPESPTGTFATGALPRIDDERVSFHVGLFEDTLPDYQPPEHEALVVNLDADLYSSTIFVLRALRPILLPGSLVYFDEFNIAAHELRAFEDFTSESGIHWQIVAAERSLTHVMFRVSAS